MKTTLKSVFLAFCALIAPAMADTMVSAAAHPEDPIKPGGTAVWTPLFQSTWDGMNVRLGGTASKVEPPNALMTKLDSFQWDARSVMPRNGFKTWADIATRGFVDRVGKEARDMLPRIPADWLEVEEDRQAVLAVSVLNRNLDFARPFPRYDRTPMGFDGSPPENGFLYFGVMKESCVNYIDSVEVLRWSRDSFTISISTKQPGEKVLLHLPRKPSSFHDACETLRNLRKLPEAGTDQSAGKTENNRLAEVDTLAVPFVTIESNQDFTSRLAGRRTHPGIDEPVEVRKAKQFVSFRMDQRGAKVEGAALLSSGWGVDEVTPRRFVFDRPFFIFLWRDKAEWPYFGAWIGDSSALVPFPTKPAPQTSPPNNE